MKRTMCHVVIVIRGWSHLPMFVSTEKSFAELWAERYNAIIREQSDRIRKTGMELLWHDRIMINTTFARVDEIPIEIFDYHAPICHICMTNEYIVSDGNRSTTGGVSRDGLSSHSVNHSTFRCKKCETRFEVISTYDLNIIPQTKELI